MNPAAFDESLGPLGPESQLGPYRILSLLGAGGAALNHPNLCTVHDVGANYLVMELVDGETLRVAIERGLPLDRTITIARQMLRALGAAAAYRSVNLTRRCT